MDRFKALGALTGAPGRESRVRVGPFLAAAALAFVLLPTVGDHIRWHEAGVAIALAVGLSLAVLLVPRFARAATPDVRAIAALLVLGILRESAGGATSGYGSLVLLPVLWVALYGSATHLRRVLVAVAAFLFLPVLLTGSPHYPPSGWRSGVLLLIVCALVGRIVRELLERERHEQDRSRAIVASMEEGFGLTGRDGVILEVNAALCRITGFSREQLVGAQPPYPFWPVDQIETLRTLARRMHAEGGGTFEATFVRPDGTRFCAELTTAKLNDASGDGGFVNGIRDISERKRAEAAERNRSAELEQLAAITRTVAHAEPGEARRTVCDIAIGLGAASAAMLWEADEAGVLHNTCTVGGPRAGVTLGPEATQSVARRAFETERAVFVSDVGQVATMDSRLRALFQAGAVLAQPIFEGNRAIGVLGLTWHEALPGLDDRQARLVALLAHEASVAIGKAEAHAELEQLAHTDVLTGLANRRALEDQFALAIATSRRRGEELSVAMIDLDHFKDYNDEHGHPRGDVLLHDAGRAWCERLRETDILARWGGEEFCLLLPDCDEQSAGQILDVLRSRTPDGQSFSAGVAAWRPGLSGGELVARADAALYEAKRQGRARTVLAAPMADAAV